MICYNLFQHSNQVHHFRETQRVIRCIKKRHIHRNKNNGFWLSLHFYTDESFVLIRPRKKNCVKLGETLEIEPKIFFYASNLKNSFCVVLLIFYHNMNAVGHWLVWIFMYFGNLPLLTKLWFLESTKTHIFDHNFQTNKATESCKVSDCR